MIYTETAIELSEELGLKEDDLEEIKDIIENKNDYDYTEKELKELNRDFMVLSERIENLKEEIVEVII